MQFPRLLRFGGSLSLDRDKVVGVGAHQVALRRRQKSFLILFVFFYIVLVFPTIKVGQLHFSIML
jgi:hypothetical protein